MVGPNTMIGVLMRKGKFGHVHTQTGKICHVFMEAGLGQGLGQSARKHLRQQYNEQTTESAGNIQGTKELQLCVGNFGEKQS